MAAFPPKTLQELLDVRDIILSYADSNPVSNLKSTAAAQMSAERH